MKTLGRILIILVVFAALSGLMIVGVNASGLSASNFRGEGGEFRPAGDQEGFLCLALDPKVSRSTANAARGAAVEYQV